MDLIGTLPGGLALGDLKLSAGRSFSPEDLATGRAARVDIDPSPVGLPFAVLQATAIEDVDYLETALAGRLDEVYPDWRARADLVSYRARAAQAARAMGARASDIRRQLLIESVLMCGVGSLLGAALGISGAYLIGFVLRRISEAPFYAAVTLSSVLFAVGASVGVGMVLGIYPARRAAQLSPVAAIRFE